jgi:hypothetical protein
MSKAFTSDARFPSIVRFRAPAGLMAALDLAARRRHQSVSELVRQTVLRELERDGVRLDQHGHVKTKQPTDFL